MSGRWSRHPLAVPGEGDAFHRPAAPTARNARGTAIEYGLIAVAAITAMKGLGNQLKTTFTNVSSNMKAS